MKLAVLVLTSLMASPAFAVTIAGKPLMRAADLSVRANLVLTTINNGTAWLDWAIRTDQKYDFDSERNLLAAIQTGLHGSPLVLIGDLGLQVHPSRLMDLSETDLRALLEIRGAADEARARIILAKNEWATQRDLSVIPQALDSLGVKNAPVFQALTLEEQLELLRAMDESISSSPQLQTEAAAFAVGESKTPLEFCDYFRMYLAVASSAGGDAASRARQVRAAQAAGLESIFGMLAGPYVTETPTTASVNAALQEWIAAGKSLGYGRLSLGIWQGAVLGLDRLQTTVMSVLSSTSEPSVRMSQTGEEYLFHYQAAGRMVTVRVDEAGSVTLAKVQ